MGKEKKEGKKKGVVNRKQLKMVEISPNVLVITDFYKSRFNFLVKGREIL